MKDDILADSIIYILLVVVIVTLILLLAICKWTVLSRCPNFIQRVFNQLQSKLMYNAVLRTLLQLYLVQTISVMSSMKDFASLDSSQVTVTISLLWILCIGFLVYSLAFPYGYFESLADPKFRAKFGSLYTGVRTDSRVTVLYSFVFLLRRLVFALIVIFLDWSLL